MVSSSVTGWGIILLGAAVLFEVGAIALTPTELQTWLQGSYFGHGKGKEAKFTKGDWKSECAALEALFKIAPAINAANDSGKNTDSDLTNTLWEAM